MILVARYVSSYRGSEALHADFVNPQNFASLGTIIAHHFAIDKVVGDVRDFPSDFANDQT